MELHTETFDTIGTDQEIAEDGNVFEDTQIFKFKIIAYA